MLIYVKKKFWDFRIILEFSKNFSWQVTRWIWWTRTLKYVESFISLNASKKTLSIITNYGREIGIAFQIANDLNNLRKGEINKNRVIPILNYLENKKYEIDSLNISSIKRKISKNSLKIEELYNNEITRHIIKAEELIKSEIIYKSQYKNLLEETPKYIIKNLLNKWYLKKIYFYLFIFFFVFLKNNTL